MLMHIAGMTRKFAVGLALILGLVSHETCFAQGFRVSTHVYDLNSRDAANREQIVSSSLSLFHNGRVYDYVDTADEVVIFDPGQKKFTILNTARDLTTTLSFEEIRRHLDKRVPTVEQYIRELSQQKNPAAAQIAKSLRFQLDPEFQPKFEPAHGKLSLSSEAWTYRVETSTWDDAEQVDRYLTYADWAARLNYVLHPNSLFPEPRIALNTSLRELKGRIPVVVELDLRPAESLQLRAQHQFRKDLDDDDRRRIARWDQAVDSKSVKHLPFLSYQQTVLVSQVR